MKDKILKEIKQTFPKFELTPKFEKYVGNFVHDIFSEVNFEDNYLEDNLKKYQPSDFVVIDCAFYLVNNLKKVQGELYAEDCELFILLKETLKADIIRFASDLEYQKCCKDLCNYAKKNNKNISKF